MSGNVLLDTNIVIALSVNDSSVLERLEEDVTVFLSSIVLGELFFGAYGSSRVSENLARITEFAANNTLLVCDSDTARHYGQIKSNLRRAGRQHDLTLVSRDAHFDHVEGLETTVW